MARMPKTAILICWLTRTVDQPAYAGRFEDRRREITGRAGFGVNAERLATKVPQGTPARRPAARKHPGRIEDYLEHIARPIERAIAYVQPVPDLEAFKKNPQVQDAVVRNIEVSVKPWKKISSNSPQFIEQHPELPWAQMRGMRNVAVHEYFSIDLEIVWITVRDDLPKLKQQIAALLNR